MMIIDNKFEFEQIVYLITDPEQLPRLIVGIDVRPNGLMYAVACGGEETPHYDFEISDTKDVLTTIDGN